MAQKSHSGGTEKNGSSLLYCKSDVREGSLQWVTEPLKDQVLLVLSMDNTCSTSSFDIELCAEKLKALGVQVPTDQWKRLIQDAVLKPEVRQYMFYNSRAFQIAIAVIFYMSLWTNLYSTVQLCSFGHFWVSIVLVTLLAVAVTALITLVLDRHQRKVLGGCTEVTLETNPYKAQFMLPQLVGSHGGSPAAPAPAVLQINVNTDVRLAAVNEIFIQHSLILGITDVLEGPHSILKLWFVSFSPERCLRSLSAHITHLQSTAQAGLRHSLDKLCVVMETSVQPDLGTEEIPCEESPLLSSGENLNKGPVTCNELLCLIPEGPPEVMAQQLLVIFSSCYVRLLVTGQLPGAVPGGHLEHSTVPCLCQFIKTTVLSTHHSWLVGR